ncbi:tRNA (guanosine(46)-N7)-methyltransferase TrmB [Thiotrichales bacterium 19S3-7]|nr:tRNA (guanosine(46)-N7)-methyltransferase TrmB [Thiotrichales bacterium 19S3-7]MCF6801644.1 tRNA (guanosine(46)-N7)-methyltransferase TrmB [Thiotrichales bacterium 19S3-11]
MTEKNQPHVIDNQDHQKPLRTIKSFVQRKGRLTKGQKRALALFSDLYLIDYQSDSQLNFDQLFDSVQPVVIEIGFGMGNSLVEMAQQNPQINYLGIEVHQPGIGNILNCIDKNQLTNLKVIRYDAIDVLKQMIPDHSISGFQIFFPDPWHKKRHHKRRLIQSDFVDLLVTKLVDGGLIHCATDWQDYAEHMLKVFNENHKLKNEFGEYAPRPESRPLTKFEKRGERLSHGVWDLIFNKIK